MSNWMTSGRARLKAKQKNSFAQRARRRAEILVPSHPVNQETSNNMYKGKLWFQKMKDRYSNSNPITRRGIEVKFGATSSHQSNITDKENCRPSNNSGIVSSQAFSLDHSVPGAPRRRIQDRNSIYNDRRKLANQRAGGNYRHSQHTVSDRSHATRSHHPSDQSLQQNLHFQNNSRSNGVFNERIQKSPSPFSRQNIPRRQYATSDISVAAFTYYPTNHSVQQNLHFQDNHTNYAVYDDSIPKSPSEFSRQDISRRKYSASDISVALSARHPINHSFHQDSYFLNEHAGNEVYKDRIKNETSHFSRQDISRKKYDTSDNSVAASSRHPLDHSFQKASHLPSNLTRSNRVNEEEIQNTTSRLSRQIMAPNSLNQTPLSRDYGKRFFQSNWQSPDRSLDHENIDTTRNTNVHRQKPSIDLDLHQKGIKRFQSVYHENIGTTRNTNDHRQQQSVGTDLHQKGLKRFQKHKEKLPVRALEEEDESKMGLSFPINNDSWGVADDNRQVGTIERKRRHVDSSRGDTFHGNELNRQWYPTQLQSENMNPENVSTREFKRPRGNLSDSNSPGIKRFKRRRHSNTKLGQPLQTQHIPSNETRFEHTSVSNGIYSFPPMSASWKGCEDQQDYSTSSIKFFDNQKETDMFGNPLNSSKSEFLCKEKFSNRFGTQHLEKYDDDFEQATSSIARQSSRRRVAHTVYTENRKHDFRQGRQSMASQSGRSIFDQTLYTENSDLDFRYRSPSIERESMHRSYHQTKSSGNFQEERQSIPRQSGRRSYHQTEDMEKSDYNFRQGRPSIPTMSGHRSYRQTQYYTKRRD